MRKKSRVTHPPTKVKTRRKPKLLFKISHAHSCQIARNKKCSSKSLVPSETTTSSRFVVVSGLAASRHNGHTTSFNQKISKAKKHCLTDPELNLERSQANVEVGQKKSRNPSGTMQRD